MRTTITLDEDLAVRLKVTARERGVPFKDVVNSAIRRGLTPEGVQSRPYRVPTRAMGLRSDVDADKALRFAGELEDAELVRKLELRK